MKKKLFFLAVAAVALASCSSDETVATNQSLEDANAISFRTFVGGNTRATSITTTDNISSFKVMAMKNSTTTSYFTWDTFTKGTDGYFVSANKHYWPASGALDFYAYAPTTLSPSDYRTFSITTAATAEAQIDLIYAASKNKTKAANANGVNLNFRHAGAQIVIKLKNSSPNLKIDVTDCKLVNLKNTGTFTAPIVYNDNASNTESGTGTGESASTFASGWDPISGSASFTSTATVNLAASAGATAYGNDNQAFILIPQAVTASSAYASVGGQPNNSYLAIKMQIKNNDEAGTVIADATSANNWAIWPIPTITWAPGYKYTYTVDLADGGYWETDDAAINPGTTVLDPVLTGAEIKFLTVTVDGWEESAQGVQNYAYAFATGTTTIGTDLPAATAGTYSIVVSGLTEAETVSVTKTGNFTSASVTPLTVPASGIVTVTGNLKAATEAATSTIKLTGSTSGDMTFSLNQVAP